MERNAGTQGTAGRGRQRKPGRLLIAKRRRAARRAEAYITDYRFPIHIESRVRSRFPGLDDGGWELVERGLREWFVCCAWRGRTVLGMPSRAVDEAWHEFILDSRAYVRFCEVAFGEYLHHTPDEAMSTPMGDALGETVRAWDRSDVGSERESVLWNLDRQLGTDQPFGLTEIELVTARSRSPYPTTSGWACAASGVGYAGCSTGGGCSGGDGGGGGCSGGGCGGGGS